MTTREKNEADRAKTLARLEATVVELLVAEAIDAAARIGHRTDPSRARHEDRIKARAELREIRREVAIDLLILATLGMSGAVPEMRRAIRRDARQVRENVARMARSLALAN